MARKALIALAYVFMSLCLLLTACSSGGSDERGSEDGDSDSKSEYDGYDGYYKGDTIADLVGVGAACTKDEDCNPQVDGDSDNDMDLDSDLEIAEIGETEEGTIMKKFCLTEFTGGYCGIKDCSEDADCPSGSKCVIHDNGSNYCFLNCVEKVDCNSNRPDDVQSNCVGNTTFVEEEVEVKSCVPPSGT